MMHHRATKGPALGAALLSTAVFAAIGVFVWGCAPKYDAAVVLRVMDQLPVASGGVVRSFGPTYMAKFDNEWGYWFSIYRVEFQEGRLALRLGRLRKAEACGLASIHHHPFYMEAFSLLSAVRAYQGRRGVAACCQRVLEGLKKGKLFGVEVMRGRFYRCCVENHV